MAVTVKTQSSSVAICHGSLASVPNQSLQNKKSSSHSLYHPCISDNLPLKNLCVSAPKLSNLSRSQTGFTLVEIVVVVVILSIFAGMMSLSVGSSDSRKNRAFYEHLTDSLNYVRLLSAERMQPMGLSLRADKQGQVTPVIVTLSNPYIAYQTADSAPNNMDSRPKNAMELSADLTNMSGAIGDQQPTPSWEVEPEVSLPELPSGVSLRVQSLESSNASVVEQRQLQPWFTDQSVPQILWFGTGQAAPVTIEVIHSSRLVGEVITIMPDGSMIVGQGL